MLLFWLAAGLIAKQADVAVEQRGRGGSPRRLRDEARKRAEQQDVIDRAVREQSEAVAEAVAARLPRKQNPAKRGRVPLPAPELAEAKPKFLMTDLFAHGEEPKLVVPDLPDAPNVDIAEVFGLNVEQTYDLELMLLAA